MSLDQQYSYLYPSAISERGKRSKRSKRSKYVRFEAHGSIHKNYTLRYAHM